MENDDLIPGGPVIGWRLFGGHGLASGRVALFARFAPEAIAYFLDPTANNTLHRSWDWQHSLAEPLTSTCLVNAEHIDPPAPDCGCGYRLCTEFDDLAAYLRRMASRGDHLVVARVETVGILRASHATVDAREDGPLDDPPSTVRAGAIRVLDVYLHQDTHDKRAYGSPDAWVEQFGSDAQVHVPPEPRRVMWRPRPDKPPQLNYTEHLGLEGWIEWIESDWAAREAAIPQGEGSARDEASL